MAVGLKETGTGMGIGELSTLLGRQDLPESIQDQKERMENAAYYSQLFNQDIEQAYDIEPELNQQVFGTEKVSNPAKIFKDAFMQSMVDKPAMMLKGAEVFTPGGALGVDKLLDKSALFLESLKDPKVTEQVQAAAQGKLWPIGDGRRWWQLEAKYVPEVINAWAANVGDQLPIMLATLAGRMAGKSLGKGVSVATAAGAALITGGPDPSDVVTAPAVAGITQKVMTHVGGAAPLVAMEAGGFMDDALHFKIDPDIAEENARLYGIGSGLIEYSQWMFRFLPYKKILSESRNRILKAALLHIGGTAFEGVEEISQEGLERHLLRRAEKQMQQRNPGFTADIPDTFEGWKRTGAIAIGVSAITKLPAAGLSMSEGRKQRAEQVLPKEALLPEVAPQEIKEVPEAPAKAAPAEDVGEVEDAFIKKQLDTLGSLSNITAKEVSVSDIPKDAPFLERAKDAESIARRLGFRVVWYSAKGSPTHGFVHQDHPEIIFSSIDHPSDMVSTIAHEAVHRVARTNPALYKKVLESLTPQARKKLADRYSLSVAKWHGIGQATEFDRKATRGDEEAVALIVSDAFGFKGIALEQSHKLRNYLLGKGSRKAALDYLKIFVSPHSNNPTVTAEALLAMYEQQPPAPQAEAVDVVPAVKPTITKPAKIKKKPPASEQETLMDIGIPRNEVSKTSPNQAKQKLQKKISPEKTTPSVVQKEFKGKQPKLTEESKDAPKVLENYWREFDEREFEVNVQTTKNQDEIAKALKKKSYLPKADVETKNTSLAMMLYIDLKEHPEGHKFADSLSKENKAVYDKSQNLPANVRKIADKIIEQNRKAGELAVEQGVIKEARNSYIAHLWERTPQRESFFAKFRQKTQRAKQRTLEGGLVEGLSRGMKLRVQDVTLASQLAQSQVNQAFVGKKLLRIGKEWGLLSHQQEAEDWVKVEHPGFTTFRFRGTLGVGGPGDIKNGDWVRAADRDNLGKVIGVKGNTATVHFVNKQKGTEADIDLPLEKLEVVKPKGAAFFVTEEGVVMEKVPVYAEPELGKKLNNIFSPSVLFKIPGVETLTRYNAILKSTLLYTSLFHHQAFLRSYAFGSHGLNPVEAFKKGKEAIMNMEPEVRMLVRNGLTLGRIQDFDPRMLEGEDTIWGKAMALTEPTEKANEWLQNLRRQQEKFLFNKLGPYLKIQAALLEFKAGMERNQTAIESGEVTADDIARAAATLMNNDFGGLHLGRMGRNNTIQHLMRLLLLAPDWTESNVRSMISAFRTGEEGYMHRMFWGRIAVKAMGATVLFNLLMAGFDDDDFVERYKKAWKEGKLRWLDVDVTPIFKAMGGKSDSRKYFSLIGHFRDPVKFVARPGASLKHKGSVVSRIIFDFASGQDWAGRQFTTVGELAGLQENGKLSGRLVKWGRGKAQFLEPNQLPSWFVYEGRQIMPIPIQNIAAFLSGEMDAFDAITKSAGLMTSTTFPKKKSSSRRRGKRR